MLMARLLRQHVTPLQAARRLVAAGAPDVALLHSVDHAPRARYSYLAAFADAHSRALDPHVSMPDVAQAGLLSEVPRWIGVLPYEARRELERPSWVQAEERPPPLISEPMWARYPAVIRFDQQHARALVVGDSLAAIERLRRLLQRPAPSEPISVEVQAPEPEAWHLDRVARAKELILDGDLYQVCLARRLDVTLAGAAIDLYAQMAARARPEFGAYLQLPGDVRVLSTSPELLLAAEVRDKSGAGDFGLLYSEPIKGTRPRAIHAVADARQRAELAADPKERAELAMIVDVVRNDLGRVAQLGSVRLAHPPHVVTHATVYHRRALLVALADEGISRAQVLASLVPSGSVTGAPKVRAMEVIRQLESARRGLYTGAIGYVAHSGQVKLAMAIRTLVLRGQVGHYWTGGGIVADSEPAREWRETGWKARQLF